MVLCIIMMERPRVPVSFKKTELIQSPFPRKKKECRLITCSIIVLNYDRLYDVSVFRSSVYYDYLNMAEYNLQHYHVLPRH